MTEEEKKIVEAIWGRDAENHSEEELLAVVNGIFSMTDIVRNKVKNGTVVSFIESDLLH